MNRKHLWPVMIALFICTITFSHAVAANDKKTDEKTKEVNPANAALVNGQPIAYNDFEMQYEMLKNRMRASGKPEAQIKKDTLEFLINNELLYQDSLKSGIKIDKKKIDEELASFKARFNDQKKFDEWLTTTGLTVERLTGHLRHNMAVRELVDKEIASKVKVSEKKVEEFYNQNPQYFQKPESARARHILIKVEKDADKKTKEAARQKLVDLKKRLDKGEKFEDLAKENSDCPSSSQGGDLGFFTRGKMVPSFEKAAFALKPGEISDIVETQFGYHLIQLVERKGPEKVELKEVKSHIEEQLKKNEMTDAVQAYIDNLRKTAKIETFVKGLDAAKK